MKGKVAVITGGAGVLCTAIAEGLAREGVKIALLDIDEEKSGEALEQVKAAGGEGLALKASVLSREEIEQAAEKILSTFGRMDILVNGAGGNHPKTTTGPKQSFFDLPEDGARFVFDLNFMGTFLSCQVFGKIMVEQKEGVILNIASMNAIRPLTRIPAYSAAKAAVTNFTQWLAVHLAQTYLARIRVNAITPGFFLTAQNCFLLQDEEGELTPRGRQIIEHTPMGRFGKPEDLVGTVLWLVSPLSQFVHGIVVPIDGGFSAYSGV